MKVKIHPKMIHNRPPLNCQKCQFRFFTDQGLERHLLGSHGLVTASMQDLANQNKDSGRCPVCGKVYQWKLLNHVAKDHQKTLKPAHLSYKCTVCTATFGQYRLFESHVYQAHSGKGKGGSGGGSGSKQQQSVVKAAAATAAATKAPVQMSKDITIIPRPAGKVRDIFVSVGQFKFKGIFKSSFSFSCLYYYVCFICSLKPVEPPRHQLPVRTPT